MKINYTSMEQQVKNYYCDPNRFQSLSLDGNSFALPLFTFYLFGLEITQTTFSFMSLPGYPSDRTEKLSLIRQGKQFNENIMLSYLNKCSVISWRAFVVSCLLPTVYIINPSTKTKPFRIQHTLALIFTNQA